MRRLLLVSAALLASSPALAQMQPQTGPFPLNSVTDREHDGPQNGQLQPSIQALQSTLTDLQQLNLELKQAHWNVSGTLFYPLHLLLQEHYEGTSKYSDQVAERLQSIGVSSDGRAHTIIRNSIIPEFPGGFVDDAQVIQWFSHYYKSVSDRIAIGIKATNDTDPSTSNLLQEVQNSIDKYQWQMRAFIQSTPTDPNTGFDINNNRPLAPAGKPSAPTN